MFCRVVETFQNNLFAQSTEATASMAKTSA